VLSAYPYSAIGFAVDATRVAINDSGTAVVIFHAGTLRAVRRTATIDWPTAAETVTATAGVNADPVVGIDGAGNVVAAFTYGSPVKVVRASLRPPAFSWLESGDLSPATPGSSATSLSLPVSTTGLAALVWLQTTDATQSVKARPGTTGTGFPGGAEEVADAGALTPAAAIGDDGTLVTVWERGTSAGNVGQARVRSPGAAGAWGDIRTVTSAHANSTTASLAADGLGDFATVSAPYDGTYHPVRLSSYDAAPPSVSGAFASGHLHARTPATLNVTARDAWSGVGDPAWTFGDGGTGTGIAATHIYARAGTYTAHVSVSDASGNTAGRDLTVVIGGPVEAALTRPRFDVTWTRSRARGTLALAGRTPFHSTYVIEVSKGRTRLLRVPLLLGYPGSPASFSIKLRVPATAVPGTYRVELQPVTPGVGSNALRAKLAAPTEGVVDNGFLSGTRTGKARTSLTRARTVWARFHLAAVPKGKLTLTRYRMAGRKRVALRSVSRPPVATVRDSLAVLGMRGTITAVLRRSGTVIFESSVRLT
jgi:PKD repeat protein